MSGQGAISAEAECVNVKMKVILPNGEVKPDVYINPENKVYEEKENILRNSNIPYPNLYVMILMGIGSARTILEDKKEMEFYLNQIASADEVYLEIKKKSSEIERPPKPVNAELFGVHLK
ncbi:uncharacterized protein LOC131948942 [Physella acuta]|uniref:uncharacterized protein LOC131948942 n=1 Tax=Physella acuta TaxID=109671 RepID=UPI0027DD4E61|nr:uncharacterized protein LOC131948942 [Physella acuta]XP_059166656.1 uncharacterized protein LOC131948942 [Physella acuta]